MKEHVLLKLEEHLVSIFALNKIIFLNCYTFILFLFVSEIEHGIFVNKSQWVYMHRKRLLCSPLQQFYHVFYLTIIIPEAFNSLRRYNVKE